MRIFIFKSDVNNELRAFAGDSAGSKLPEQFGPWRGVGVIRDDTQPPFQLPRKAIESAISEKGFQLWRMKTQQEPQPKTKTKVKAKSKAA